LWLESSEEHLPTSIAGVLRLRAISRPLCDRSAWRFAQDDGFVGGVKSIRLATQKTRKDRKSHRLSGWQRGGRGFHGERLLNRGRFSSPWVGRRPMSTPVGTTILFVNENIFLSKFDFQANLSSRPGR